MAAGGRTSTDQLTQAVKQQALRLGFSWVGVAIPGTPRHYLDFERWLEAGRHAEMEYLASERSRQRRADPRQILPECRSILALGMAYAPANVRFFPGEPGLTGAPGGLRGRVAAYAWGQDYHEVLPGRMRSLVSFLEAQTGQPVASRYYTDTGAILERDLAQRAGLGWIGKNTCLIHPRQGSYLFLAEILLGLELTPDAPFESDRCGSCRRCLDACPTSCILPDRTIDAARCISYLTIELKGAIPRPLRPHIQDWVFGCDLCQQVCPWNQRFALPAPEPAFLPRQDVPRPDLLAALQLSPQEFNRRFKGSPILRAKRRGYLRNVAVVLGNLKDPAAAPTLIQALKMDAEPLVRQHAAWALGQIGGQDSRQALQAALAHEADAQVLLEIRLALEALDVS